MGRRLGMIEQTDAGFVIRYPMEKHNEFNQIKHSHCSNACEDLIKSLILFSYDNDKINIYSDFKFHSSLNIYISKYRDLIKSKNIIIKLKDDPKTNYIRG